MSNNNFSLNFADSENFLEMETDRDMPELGNINIEDVLSDDSQPPVPVVSNNEVQNSQTDQGINCGDEVDKYFKEFVLNFNVNTIEDLPDEYQQTITAETPVQVISETQSSFENSTSPYHYQQSPGNELTELHAYNQGQEEYFGTGTSSSETNAEYNSNSGLSFVNPLNQLPSAINNFENIQNFGQETIGQNQNFEHLPLMTANFENINAHSGLSFVNPLNQLSQDKEFQNLNQTFSNTPTGTVIQTFGQNYFEPGPSTSTTNFERSFVNPLNHFLPEKNNSIVQPVQTFGQDKIVQNFKQVPTTSRTNFEHFGMEVETDQNMSTNNENLIGIKFKEVTTYENPSIETSFKFLDEFVGVLMKSPSFDNQKVHDALTYMTNLSDRNSSIFEIGKILKRLILDEELMKWKSGQKEHCINYAGTQFDPDTLEKIEKWTVNLVEILWKVRKYLIGLIKNINGITIYLKKLKTSQNPFKTKNSSNGIANPNYNMSPDSDLYLIEGSLKTVDEYSKAYWEFKEKVEVLFKKIVVASFIVTIQPQQVMKTKNIFKTSLRLLIGNRLGFLKSNVKTKLKVDIIREDQANFLLKEYLDEKTMSSLKSGSIKNNSLELDINDSQQISANFTISKLEEIKRTKEKGKEKAKYVTDEKFCLHFYFDLQFGEKLEVIKVWTFSLPICVIVGALQEIDAWGSVIFNNAFGPSNFLTKPVSKMTIFSTPEQVPWTDFKKILSLKFEQLGHPLSEGNLEFLKGKIPRKVSQNPAFVNRTQIFKERLSGLDYTFWQWFYSIWKLTKEFLVNEEKPQNHFDEDKISYSGPWAEGLIIGFISREDTRSILSQPDIQEGTFLLRFSESYLGGISIFSLTKNNRTVLDYAPFLQKHLASRPLVLALHDINEIQYLYTTDHRILSKENAFPKIEDPALENEKLEKKKGISRYARRLILTWSILF